MIRFTSFLVVFSFIASSAFALTLGQAAQITQTAKQAAFQSIEMVAYDAAARTPQWQGVKKALKGDMRHLQNCLDNAGACQGEAQIAWRAMVLALTHQPTDVKLDMVNAFFNKWQYRSDADAYGESDHWATPIAFMTNGGDCEDYAIAKYTTLLFLGFSDDDMRITAVIDQNRGGVGHAVLNVQSDVGDAGNVVLDNLTNVVYADNQQTGYTPRFAVNQTGVYTYAQAPQAQIVWASLEQ